jgi:hypothetical protein
VSFVQQYFLTGWGGLFPGGYKPVTPFAGSWEPGGRSAQPLELDDDTPDAPEEKPGASDGQAAASKNGQRGRSAARPGKEKRRSAKR